MLVLTLRENERIMVGDNIKITLVKLYGDRISIGFDAPREVQIDREKIYQEKLSDRTSNRSNP